MPLKVIKITLLITAVSLLFFSTWFFIEFYYPPKISPKKIIFEVERGQGVKNIAHNLEEMGIIQKKWPFLIGNELFFSPKSLKAGEYAFDLPVSIKDILSTITEGRVYLHSITIPEGLIRLEIADLLHSLHFVSQQDFLESSTVTELISSFDKNAEDLEGYLFPETYHFSKGTPAHKIVSAMVSQFQEVFDEGWKRRAEEMGMTIREIVILASLIEKETSLREEKPLVSAVFRNRLKRGMKLDCDPTIIYALKQEGQFKDRLRTRDLKLDTPYNTYFYPGFPPGPIANPGLDSLEAALYPSEEKYLYFVSKNDGSHHFSRTFIEHQRAVNKYQRKRR